MNKPHDSADAMIHQVVFRWAGNRAGSSAGLTAVAQSCGERDARAMAEQLGPILRVRRGDRRSIVRTIWNDRAVLVRRSPKADAQGRGSTVCHALISPTKLLTASFCLGLGASPWGEGNWTQASGPLPSIPYEVLNAMANHAIPRLDAAVSSLARPLQCLVAQLLRTPGGRISAHNRGLDDTRSDDLTEVPDPALVVLRGLCEVFGGTLGGEGWTYASYDTVDSHPLRVTFVPSWRASHEEDVRLRRIDLIEPGSDHAAVLAERLVRHYLDYIETAARGSGAGKGRSQYRRPLEQLMGPLAGIEDETERYEAIDRALRGLSSGAPANRASAPPQQRAARTPGREQGPEGPAPGGSPSVAAGATHGGRPDDRDAGRGRAPGPGRSAPAAHGASHDGSATSRGHHATASGRGDSPMVGSGAAEHSLGPAWSGGGEPGAGSAVSSTGTTAAAWAGSAGSAGSGVQPGTDAHPPTGSRSSEPEAVAGQTNRSGAPAHDAPARRSAAAPVAGQGAPRPDVPSASAPSNPASSGSVSASAAAGGPPVDGFAVDGSPVGGPGASGFTTSGSTASGWAASGRTPTAQTATARTATGGTATGGAPLGPESARKVPATGAAQQGPGQAGPAQGESTSTGYVSGDSASTGYVSGDLASTGYVSGDSASARSASTGLTSRGADTAGYPSSGSVSASAPGSPGRAADSLAGGSAPASSALDRHHTTNSASSSMTTDAQHPSYAPAQQADFRQYAPNPSSPTTSLPAPPSGSGFDLAVNPERPGSSTAPPNTYDPASGSNEQPRAVPPKPKSPPPPSGPAPSHYSQQLHVDPGPLLGLSNPFPRKRGKRRTRVNVDHAQLRQVVTDLNCATGGDHAAEDLKRKVRQDLERLSDVDLLSVLHTPLSYEAQNLVLETLASVPRLEDELESLGELLLDRSFLLRIGPLGQALWDPPHVDRVIKVACWLFCALQKTLASERLAERVGWVLRHLASSPSDLSEAFIETLLIYAPSDALPALPNLVWRELARGLHERLPRPPDEAPSN
ncbi:hypothetical protein [Streptomyces albipurpureus]|uniref:Uncharacterized protein n=1 Tax=Streptomyces albipurpureus TaxID=2897419 RepID=A0ABT0UK62_9ACTN|nr:hypothetical protein [Streptomyces sp. CWNU-1]MCM2388845.1 hypothetical protein [Streptomyces sp. CWNU-1]